MSKSNKSLQQQITKELEALSLTLAGKSTLPFRTESEDLYKQM